MIPPPQTGSSIKPLLEVTDLSVHFPTVDGSPFKAVDALSFSIGKGETVALVGESGCGKSTSALAIMRLLRKPGTIAGGSILFDGQNLLQLPEKELQQLRGKSVSMIFQEPMTSLNPVMKVGYQIAEGILQHNDTTRDGATREAVRLLARVGIPAPEERYHAYPHQMSGGMKQRVMIAMALACGPKLLIADEPTTALDVTIQAEILELIDQLKRELAMSLLLITHNLGIVAERANRTAVMYAGRMVEAAPTDRLLAAALHPYTKGLLASLPQNSPPRTELPTIANGGGEYLSAEHGCLFSARCPYSEQDCRKAVPELVEMAPGHHVACWRVKQP